MTKQRGAGGPFFTSKRRFDSTAYQQALAPPVSPAAMGTFAPGEALWRTMDTAADVIAPRQYAWTWAIDAMLFTAALTGAMAISRWFWLGVVGTFTFGLVFGIITVPILRRDNEWYKMRQRDAEGTVANTPAVTYAVEGTLHTAKGQSLYLKFGLESAASARAWHRFCADVEAGTANFSGRAAKDHGLTDTDWKRIYRAFTSQHWATAASARSTPQLSPTGKAWVRQFASTPPPAASA